MAFAAPTIGIIGELAAVLSMSCIIVCLCTSFTRLDICISTHVVAAFLARHCNIVPYSDAYHLIILFLKSDGF